MTRRRGRLRTALAIRDGERLVVRADPFGSRPVYYRHTVGGDTVVSSSLNALAEAAGGLGPIDPAALQRTLLGWPRADETLFTTVQRVPPGKEARFERGSVVLKEPELPPIAEQAATPAGVLESLRAVVARHARDPGTACALSGGLDSATLLALLSERTDDPVLAVSLASSGSEDPELEQGRALVKALGARHEVVEVAAADLPERFEEAVLACEAPLFNARAVAKCELWRRAAELTGSAVLSGVGADEVLFGHPAVLAAEPGRPTLFEAALGPQRELAASLIAGGTATAPPAAPTGAISWAATRFVDHVLLHHTTPLESPAGAAHGVDVRLPFLDEAFARWARSLSPADLVRPWPFAPGQLRDGEVLGKSLLREALPTVLGADICRRAKVPRLEPAGGPDARARRGWWEVFARVLGSDDLDLLSGLDRRAVAALVERFRDLPQGPELDATDRVLMQLASVVVLARGLSGGGPSADAT